MMLWCPSSIYPPTIHNMPYYCLYALVTTSNYVLHCIIIFVLYCISLLSAFFSVAPCFLLYFLSICLDYFHLCVVCLLFLAPIQPSVFIQHINSHVRMYLLCSCKCSQSAALCCYSHLCFWMKSSPPFQVCYCGHAFQIHSCSRIRKAYCDTLKHIKLHNCFYFVQSL